MASQDIILPWYRYLDFPKAVLRRCTRGLHIQDEGDAKNNCSGSGSGSAVVMMATEMTCHAPFLLIRTHPIACGMSAIVYGAASGLRFGHFGTCVFLQLAFKTACSERQVLRTLRS